MTELKLHLNIDFIRQATLGWCDRDGWAYVNADNVRFADADPLYQFMGSDYPGSATISEDTWCKLVFSNGKNRGVAYFGVAIERFRDEDRAYVASFLAGADSATWLGHLCKEEHGFRLVNGWDPYRERADDSTPPTGSLNQHDDPVSALRGGEGGLCLLKEIPLTPETTELQVQEAIQAALPLALPIWRSIVLHQIG